MSRSMKKGVCVLMTLLFLFTLVLPVFAMEIETGQEPANDAAQDFIDTVNTLDRDAIIAASNAWGLASQAWQADQKNEELTAAMDEAIAAQDEAAASLYAAEDLYYLLNEEEQQREDVQTAYSVLCSLYTAMCSASFSASMTVKVDKTANITHERLNDAEITVSGSPANGSLDGGSWSLTPSPQVIRTVNGDGSVTFTYSGSVTKSVSRSASGSVTGKSSQSEADSEAASQQAAAESSLRGEARAAAQNQANAIANAAARQARAFLVRETGVPHGFDATASSEQGQTVQPDGSSTAVIYNQPWQCSVKWEKLDNITGGRLTEDTRFTFYEWNTSANDYEVSPNYRVIRLADGTYTVRCINPNYTGWQERFVYYTQTNLGRFKITETTAAYGYNYNPWSVEFTISRQNDTAHYLGSNADRNQPWGNKLIIHKTDSETGNEITGDAVFSLYEWNAQRGLYEISTNYALVRDADGSYTVKCLHTDWTQAQYGSLYFEDTLCDTRQDAANHDGTASAHPVYYTDYDMTGYPNSQAFTNDGQFLVVEHKAPSGYYGDWTDVQNPGTAGSDLGKRAYYGNDEKTGQSAASVSAQRTV